MDEKLATPVRVLQIAFGLTATLAGLDKFFNLLADWGSYVSPLAAAISPLPVSALMAIVGVVEMAVGATVLVVAPRLGAYVVCVWLLLVAANLVIGGHFDIAVRDIVMSISAFVLARELEARDAATVADKRAVLA